MQYLSADTPDTPVCDEQQLLLRIASGSEDAFNTLYRRYHDTVHRFILRFVKSREYSNDLVQEVFIKIWENRSRLAAVRSFKAYLLIVSQNHTLSFLKNIAKDHAATSEMIRHYQPFRNYTEEKLLTKEYWQYLEKILHALPEQTCKVFSLCRQDKNYDEVARTLGISRNAVKKHIVRANRIFKSSVKNLLDISIKSLALLVFFK